MYEFMCEFVKEFFTNSYTNLCVLLKFVRIRANSYDFLHEKLVILQMACTVVDLNPAI